MSQISSYPLTTSRSPAPTAQALPPQLPAHIEVWSTRALAAWLDVSTSTVKYHARQAFRDHVGRWELSRDQAQRVVNRIFQFGQLRTLSKPEDGLGPDSTTARSTTTHSTTARSTSCSETASEGEWKKIERLLNES